MCLRLVTPSQGNALRGGPAEKERKIQQWYQVECVERVGARGQVSAGAGVEKKG